MTRSVPERRVLASPVRVDSFAPSRPDRDRRPSFAPALIAGAAALFLVYQWRLGRMLWLDEEMVAINLRERSIAQLAGRLSLGQAAPYGWLVVQRLVITFAGTHERALRALPLLFGLALLATSVWIGRRWLATTGAIILAFLSAVGQWVWFNALELKHYSADACFALLLPGLAVWAIETDRVVAWWIVAAIAQWLSNGALFVAPVGAAIIVAARGSGGPRFNPGAAIRHGLGAGAVVWMLSFTVNYLVTLGPVRSNEFLLSYWRNAFPPASAGGLVASIRWVVDQLPRLASNPAGSGYGLWFWLAAAAGFASTTRAPVRLRAAFALVPLSALVWAAVRLVPLFERLSLWIVPAAYVGVALAADAVAGLAASARRSRQIPLVIIAAAAAVIVGAIVADIARRGATYLSFDEPVANHEVDDRTAVRWLARQQQPGDVWVTTHNALPAIWWYAPNAATIFEAAADADRSACGGNELGASLARAGAARALIYLGFNHYAEPHFDVSLLARLGEIGRVMAYDSSGERGHAFVVDLRQPPMGPITFASLGARYEPPALESPGCVALTAAERW